MEQGLILEVLNLGIAGVLLVMLLRGDVVPRTILTREIERGDKATEAASNNSIALMDVSSAVKEVASSVKEVRTELGAVRDELRRG